MTMRILFATVVAALALGGCAKSEPDKAPPAKSATAPAKDPATAKRMIADGAVVIDVRTPDEFAGEHLPAATNIPVQELSARLSDVAKLVGGDKAKPIVVYCGSGARAGKAKRALEEAGYTNVVNGGGLDDLRDSP